MFFYGSNYPLVRSKLNEHCRVNGLVLIVFLSYPLTQPGSHPAVHNFLKTVDYLSSGSKTVPVFSQVRFREAGQRCNL